MLLNKIYALVQAGRCLFNIFCNGKFEQSETDLRVFRKFGEVEMVVFVHVNDIFAHAHATIQWFVPGP